MTPFIVLGVAAWAWACLAIGVLVHEIGHARAASQYSSGVWLQWGRGRRLHLLEGRGTRLFKWAAGISNADLWLGEIWREGSCIGHTGLEDRNLHLRLYRAGYRANLFAGAILLAIALILASELWPAWLLAGALLIASFVNFVLAFINAVIKKDWSDRPPYGSDAWNIAQLKHDRSFTPHTPMNASELRIAKGIPLAAEER